MTVHQATSPKRSIDRSVRTGAPASPVDARNSDIRITDIAVAGGSAAAQAAGWAAHLAKRVVSPALLAARVASRPLNERYSPERVIREVAAQGRRQRMAMPPAVARMLRQLASPLLNAILDEIDVTRLVTQRVDLDAIVRDVDLDAAVARVDLAAIIDRVLSQIDVNEIAARVDVDAILERVDLIGLARYVIDGVDLPEIVRESTGSMASEGIRGMRMRTIDADERVNRVVDYLLLRRHAQRAEGRDAAVTSDSPPDGRESP